MHDIDLDNQTTCFVDINKYNDIIINKLFDLDEVFLVLSDSNAFDI